MPSAVITILFAGMLLLAACTSGSDTDTLAQIEADGWRMIAAGEGTGCALGDPYSFFVRSGLDADNVVLYFQAGGACWSAESCLPDNPLPIYDQTVTPGEFDWYEGIFDFSNSANPIRNYDMVFVPLCTGDAHVGSATVTYRTVGDQFQLTIQHNGYNNVRAVLDWFYSTYPDPQRIWVIGSSAGSLASLYYYPEIVEQYSSADVSLFGDGYLGVFPRGWDAMEVWNIQANLPTQIPGIDELDLNDFTITEIMLAATRFHQNRRFAIYTHAADAFQLAYYGLAGGDMTRWYIEQQEILEAYNQQANLNYYVGEGVLHTILAFDEFYTMNTQDVAFRDWFADFLDGKPLTNVACERGTVFCP